jgi:4-hydroxy-tetrahydrodipicolinate synthase
VSQVATALAAGGSDTTFVGITTAGDLDQRQIRARIGADHLGVELAPVGDADLRRALGVEVAVVVEVAGGDRVMAGTSTYSTAESVELTQLAEKAGAGSLLLVTPYYSKPPQSGLVAHFSAIAGSTGLPCMLYNIPGRTACTIEGPTMLRLFEQLDNVVAVKDAVGDMAAASRLHRETGGQMEQYSGDDKNLLPLLAVGGVGVVSVASHLVGPALQELVRAFERGDTAAALDLHLRHLELFEGLFATSSPILLKACMNLLGLPAGPLRPPLVDATGDQVEFARGLLAGVGLEPRD